MFPAVILMIELSVAILIIRSGAMAVMMKLLPMAEMIRCTVVMAEIFYMVIWVPIRCTAVRGMT